MSRKPLGKAGRTVTKTVKLTQFEVEYLEQRYGSASTGLRVAMDRLLPDSVHELGRAPRSERVISTQNSLFSDKTSCGPAVTDHPGWTVIARGPKTKTVIKACRVCGDRVTERE